MLALTSHRQTQLRHTTDADGENDDGAGDKGGEQRHRDGHLPVCAKKLNSHVACVLSDEVDECHANDHSDRSGEPRSRRASVAKNFRLTF